ncbi:MAG: transporter substrate-binding domain-containing protein, partial [Rhodospirillales bacterium]|nr:transporter substrate-binding domain-containing protein [Rhodospirillales bacterium]
QMGLDLKVLEPPLAAVAMYMFLHKKHEAIIGKVEDALRKMKEDGTYKAIVDKTLTPLAMSGKR